MSKHYKDNEHLISKEENSFGREETIYKYKHPSFGQIKASRIQGGQSWMYASRASHQNKIMVSIFSSEHIVDEYFQERYYSSIKPLAEVEMTESQWATFISTLNTGSGTPCTIRYVNENDIPLPPEPISNIEYFDDQINLKKETILKQVKQSNEKAINAINDLKIPKKKKDELMNFVLAPYRHFESNLNFFFKCMEEGKEKIVTQAKQEVEAFINNARMNLPENMKDNKILEYRIDQKLIE